MTLYNIGKSKQDSDCKQNIITCKQNIISKLQENNALLRTEISEFPNIMAKALNAQRDKLDIRHKAIVKSHSNNLKEIYEKNFNESKNQFEVKIDLLNKKLAIANKNVLSSNMKKPIFSPGLFSRNNPIDLSCDKPSSNPENCAATFVDQAPENDRPLTTTIDQSPQNDSTALDSGQRSRRRRPDPPQLGPEPSECAQS